MTAQGGARPLDGIVVLDLVEGALAPLTRIYADLGAQVLRIELPGWSPPANAQSRLAEELGNLGKQVRRLDPADEAEAADFDDLLARADLIVTSGGRTAARERIEAAFERRQELVVLVATMFGEGNACSDWQATDPVLHALSGELSRSGIRDREPLLPPGEIALRSAMAQASYAGLAALYAALTEQEGDWIDFAALEGAVQALDPGFGSSGVASAGRSAATLSRRRPAKGIRYPIFDSADGRIRVCLLSSRQWQGMFRWMGEPAAFAGPEFNSMMKRYSTPELTDALGEFFADKPGLDLDRQAAEFGVPLTILRHFEDCLSADQLVVRQAFTTVELTSGRSAAIPNGVMEIDGSRMGPRQPTAAGGLPDTTVARTGKTGRTLRELRILDLGVIVVGAESARLFADLGSDVVKVEAASFPDGLRQGNDLMTLSFAAGHRNKRSLGLNIRHPEGRELFLRLAAKADVMFSNFKAGTTESLKIGHDAVAAVNPGIVTVESSAFGASGPWKARLGYGPLVRAAAGVSEAWRYPGDVDSHSDSVTVYPDHVAGRIGAIAAFALLVRRLATNAGGAVKISQMEVMLDHFAKEIVAESLADDDLVGPPDAPWGVYQAAGNDEWCVVTVRDDADWARLAPLIGCDVQEFGSRADRLNGRESIEAALRAWLEARSAEAAMTELQAAGVPAARMLRVADLPGFVFFAERDFFTTERHPSLEDELVSERRPFRGRRMGEAPQRPAPLVADHTSEVVRDWLGMNDDEINRLVHKGVLELRPIEDDAPSDDRAFEKEGVVNQ